MGETFEERLGTMLRVLLGQGLCLDAACSETIVQVLGTRDALEVEALLALSEDAETESMRDLALFPDMGLAVAVEQWLAAEKESWSSHPPDMQALAKVLSGAEARLIFFDLGEMRLRLHQEDARQFLTRLHLWKVVPGSVFTLLHDNADLLGRKTALEMCVACKRARLDWTPVQEAFVLALLRSCLQAAANDALRGQALPLLQWCLGFLDHAGKDISSALARRRDDLRRYMDQALELHRIREKNNYEIRRMLGLAEPCLDLAALHRELLQVDMAARATGGYPLLFQAMEHDLGDVRSVQRLISLLDV